MSSSRGLPMSRMWRDDEEMAKKDDDLGLPKHTRHAGRWNAARPPRRRSMLRLAGYFLLVIAVTLLIYRGLTSHDPPRGSLSNEARLRGATKQHPKTAYNPPQQKRPPKIPVADSVKGGKHEVAENPTYNGPVKLPLLGKSLRSITATAGASVRNRNVLFAAASLQSAATLLPMACQMGRERTNYVHFALMSRSDISMKELLKINGIDPTCSLILHDARPDYSTTSTDSRMMLASARALFYINTYMHPQAIIIDSTNLEEDYFLFGMRDEARATKAAFIELPEKSATRFGWLAKLDSSSLAAWNDVHFDILVQAPPTGSGNLNRLLKSLSRADLSPISVPHLTIEMPPVVEPPMERLLAGFKWPPSSPDLRITPQMLSLRKRIPRQTLSEDEASVKFLELFWPTDPAHSHVLVLSPHTEVTPQFFHYVKYSLLHNLYSAGATRQSLDSRLMGISLSVPRTQLDTTKPFTPPSLNDKETAEESGTPFLWQAPNSDAVLFMGERWVELHGYIAQLLDKKHAASSTLPFLAKKEVGKMYPAWLEFALQLARLRGYFTLYPSQQTASTVVGVHSDLHDVPEEYQGDDKTDKGAEEEVADHASDMFDSSSQIDMLATLPDGGELPALKVLPLLSWDGTKTDVDAFTSTALQFEKEFRQHVGQCGEAGDKKHIPANDARDLFCIAKVERRV